MPASAIVLEYRLEAPILILGQDGAAVGCDAVEQNAEVDAKYSGGEGGQYGLVLHEVCVWLSE